MPRAIWSFIGEIVQTAIVSLLIFLFIYVFLFQPHRVKGNSMVPTFEDNELLLTEKISYYFGKPKRGDIIVFEAPQARKADFIKRIIGLPDETVEINNNSVFINGNKIEEDYIKVPTSGNILLKLGPDEYFVLGDNRTASSDSRYFGSIKDNSLKGKAWLVYWPIFKNEKFGGLRIISGTNYSIPNAFENF